MNRLGQVGLGMAMLMCSGMMLGQAPPSTPGTSSPDKGYHPDFASKGLDPTVRSNINYHSYDKAPLKLSTTTTYIQVPVVVTDKDDKFIGGLKKEDFKIFEN